MQQHTPLPSNRGRGGLRVMQFLDSYVSSSKLALAHHACPNQSIKKSECFSTLHWGGGGRRRPTLYTSAKLFHYCEASQINLTTTKLFLCEHVLLSRENQKHENRKSGSETKGLVPEGSWVHQDWRCHQGSPLWFEPASGGPSWNFWLLKACLM